MYQGQESELPLGRQGGFRFIEQVKSRSNSILQHGEEYFAVGLLVQRPSAVTLVRVTPKSCVVKIWVALARIEERGEVGMKLGSEKITVPRLLAKRRSQNLRKRAFQFWSVVVCQFGWPATRNGKPGKRRNRLDKSRLARSILSHKESDGLAKHQIKFGDEWEIVGVRWILWESIGDNF